MYQRAAAPALLLLAILTLLAPLASPPARAAEPAGSSYLTETWSTGILGSGIGASKLTARDIDRDGALEIVAGGGFGFGPNTFWSVLTYDAQAATYRQEWVSKGYGESTIARIEVAPLGAGDRIYVALTGGGVEVYDGASRRLLHTLASGVVNVRSLAIADLNQDGAAELIVGGESTIAAFDQASYAPRWQIGANASALAVGNVDSDAALELVTAGSVIDGVSRAVEWSFSSGFGTRVQLADFDGDGRAEIVGAADWYNIRIYDAVTRAMEWELTTGLDIAALLVADVDGDGVADILYGDGQWGSVHAFSGATRAKLWAVSNPEHGVSAIAFADVDGDGASELLWGAGWSSTGGDYLYVANPTTRKVEWRSTDIGGPLSAVDVGDVDGDGRQEIVVVSSESDSGYNDGIMFIYDAATHALEWQSKPLLGGSAWSGVNALKIADVDGDGTLDIVVASARLYDGVILVYDGKTRALKWETTKVYGASFKTLAIGDLDADGKPEVIGGDSVEHTGAKGSYVHVYEGATGAEEWAVPVATGFAQGAGAIEASDLDGDGRAELIFAAGGPAKVYNTATRGLLWEAGSGVTALLAADVDGDGQRELLTGSSSGLIRAYDGKARAQEWSLQASATTLFALRYVVGGGNLLPTLVASDNEGVRIFDAASRALLGQSQRLGGAVGRGGHLVVADVDADADTDIVVGDTFALHQLAYDVPPFTAAMQAAAPLARPGGEVAFTLRLRSFSRVGMFMYSQTPIPALLDPESVTVDGPHQVTVEDGVVSWAHELAAGAEVALTIAGRARADAPNGAAIAAVALVNGDNFAFERGASVTVDAAPPSVTILSPRDEQLLTAPQLTISGSAADALAGVARVEVQIDDGPWRLASGTSAWELPWELPLADTTATIRARAVDGLGNVGPAGAAVHVSIDNLAPRIVATTPAHNARGVDPAAPITVTFSEPVRPEGLRVSCQSDLADLAISLSEDGRTATLAHAPLLSGQLYTCVVATAQDRAGRALVPGQAPNPWSFATPSVVAPLIEALAIDDGALATASPAVALRLDAYDPDGPGSQMQMSFSNDGQAWGVWQPYAPLSEWRLEAGTGVRTVYARLRDAYGNLSAVVSDSIRLEAAAPGYTVTINQSAVFTQRAAVTLALSAPTGTADMQISNDGGFPGATWEPYRASKPWLLTTYGKTAIPRVVYVRFRDEDGRVSAVYQDDILLDMTPPSARVRVEGSGGALVLAIDAEDDVSGVDAMRVSAQADFAGAAWQPFAAVKPWPTAAGRTLYIQLRDTAGNLSDVYAVELAQTYFVALPLLLR